MHLLEAGEFGAFNDETEGFFSGTDEGDFFSIDNEAHRGDILLDEVAALHIFFVIIEDVVFYFSIAAPPDRLDRDAVRFSTIRKPQEKIFAEEIQHLFIGPVEIERDVLMPKDVFEELFGSVFPFKKADLRLDGLGFVDEGG